MVKLTQTGIHTTMKYTSSSGANTGTNYPIVRNIDIRDCAFASLPTRAVWLEGWDTTNRLNDVTIANCRFATAPSANFFSNTNNISLFNNRGAGL